MIEETRDISHFFSSYTKGSLLDHQEDAENQDRKVNLQFFVIPEDRERLPYGTFRGDPLENSL